MSALPKLRLSEEEYLTLERAAETKSEFYDGEMFAMAGARENHILISGNISYELNRQLRRRPCRVYANDMRVKVEPGGLYTYPDLVAVCQPPRFLDDRRDTLLNPQVIIEVLSDSTEAYDRGNKAAFYRRSPSLTDYLLVSQKHPHLEHYHRQADNLWTLTEITDPDAALRLDVLDCSLRLADVYENVTFDDPGAPLRVATTESR